MTATAPVTALPGVAQRQLLLGPMAAEQARPSPFSRLLTLTLTTDPNPNQAARLFRALAPRPISRLELCCDEPAALKRELGALLAELTLTLNPNLTLTL